MKKILGLLFFLIGGSLFAGTTGKIAGKIVDAETGEPLPYAQIVLIHKIENNKKIPLSSPYGAVSDVKGEYFIINVPPGRYVIQVSFIGYKTIKQSPIEVAVDRTLTLNFSLTPESIKGEEVVITATKNMVVLDRTSSSAKVSGDDISNMPVESFSDIVELKAGITKGIGGDIHIRGGRSSEVQYYVDGVPVTNPFSNSLAVPVENNAISELEVISGTFNAEYGQAMSGIINIVTRDGTDELSGNINLYTGDFVSTHNDIFYNIDDIDPFTQKYIEANISGPLFTKRLKFFISGKISDLDNWLYGREVFLPSDSSSFKATDPSQYYIEKSGDSSAVPMNWEKSISSLSKLTYRLTDNIKLTYSLIFNKSNWKNYNHFYHYNPYYLPEYFSTSYNNMVKIEHSLSPRYFYNLNIGYYVTDYKRYVYKNPYDERYRYIYKRGIQPQFVFSTGGVDPNHVYRKSYTYTIKYDFTGQVNKFNLLKTGFEYRRHKLKYEYFSIDVNPSVWGDFKSHIPPLTSLLHNKYNHEPVEVAYYIQDKIEFKDLIVNIGVRFDYFDANFVVPTDLRDPANKFYPRSYNEAYKKVDPKMQISPRLGFAFPITDRGVFHASFGQFFQIPEFGRLYSNSEFEIAGTYGSLIGNADLDAQRTDMYELGLQQQLTDFLASDITIYYRDVRNLLGTDLHVAYQNDIIYGRYVNDDYGNVMGISISTTISDPSSGFSGSIDYTYQVAKGIASDPQQELWDAAGRNESARFLSPLDWDLRHVLNFYFNYRTKIWGMSIIGKFNSGYPFTPSGYVELRNMGRHKGDFELDLNIFRNFKLFKYNFQIYTKIENLFDKYREEFLPQIDPLDLEAHHQNGLDLVNTRYQYLLNPTLQPRPREVKIGMRVSF